MKVIRKIVNSVHRLVAAFRRFARSSKLDAVIAAAVAVNTAVMCLEHARDSNVGRMWGDGERGDLVHVRSVDFPPQ